MQAHARWSYPPRWARAGGGRTNLGLLETARICVLELCRRHGLPMAHEGIWLPVSFAAPNATYLPSDECVQAVREPVATWRYWARQARGLLNVLVRLRTGEPGRREDWIALAEQPPWMPPPALAGLAAAVDTYPPGGQASLDVERDIAATALETWLLLSGVSLHLRWPKGNPEVGVGGGQLAGAIGLGLMLAATGATAWVVCPGCGTQHPSKPTGGRRPRYCPACIKAHKPQEAAQRRYRATSAYREANAKRSRTRRAKEALKRAAAAPSVLTEWE
jgi:hypothetical protein